MYIISFDPGEQNFAWSITQHRSVNGLFESRCLENGLIKNTIKTLKDQAKLQQEAHEFYMEIASLFDKHVWSVVAMERFMGRGIRVGTTSETTNIMMGIIAHFVWTRYEQTFPLLVNAATWKTAFDRNTSRALSDSYKLCGTTPHQYDASLIGVFAACNNQQIVPFKHLSDIMLADKFMASVERASDISLTKRRAKRTFYSEVEWKPKR